MVGTLSDIVARAAMARLEPPVCAVIGEVVRLRERLRWFETGEAWEAGYRERVQKV